MKSLRFFRCNHCGNVVVRLLDKGVPVFCCGEKMEEIFANIVEASTEKHLPVVCVKDGFAEVVVGSVAHPMEEAHYINFVAVETENGYTIKTFQPQSEPKAKVYVGDEKVVAVYEYCNLHGLWKSEVK